MKWSEGKLKTENAIILKFTFTIFTEKKKSPRFLIWANSLRQFVILFFVSLTFWTPQQNTHLQTLRWKPAESRAGAEIRSDTVGEGRKEKLKIDTRDIAIRTANRVE